MVQAYLSFVATQLHLRQLEFTSLLHELQQEPVFDLRKFESACGQIRDTVAEVSNKLFDFNNNVLPPPLVAMEVACGRG